MVSKIDGTTNEVTGVVVEGYPTILFYPKGENKKPIHYKGKNTEKAIISFLKKNMGADWRDN